MGVGGGRGAGGGILRLTRLSVGGGRGGGVCNEGRRASEEACRGETTQATNGPKSTQPDDVAASKFSHQTPPPPPPKKKQTKNQSANLSP